MDEEDKNTVESEITELKMALDFLTEIGFNVHLATFTMADMVKISL